MGWDLHPLIGLFLFFALSVSCWTTLEIQSTDYQEHGFANEFLLYTNFFNKIYNTVTRLNREYCIFSYYAF